MAKAVRTMVMSVLNSGSNLTLKQALIVRACFFLSESLTITVNKYN